MGTEKYWQQERENIKKNSDTINPLITQTMQDAKELIPPKHPKALYADCLQGALFWNQWAESDDLSLPDMAMIICRDTGCELTYCQATMRDPYERPFENCEQQFRQMNSCIAQEQKRYAINPEGRTMQEHVKYMLEKKKKEKYFNIMSDQTIEAQVQNQPVKEKDYFIREPKITLENNKL